MIKLTSEAARTLAIQLKEEIELYHGELKNKEDRSLMLRFFIDEFTHEPDQYNYYCDSNKTFILCTCKKNDLNSPYPNHIYLETIASGVHAKGAMSKALAFLDTLTSYGITLSSVNKSLVTYYEQYGFRFIKTLTEDWSTIGLEPSKTVYFMVRDK